MPLLITKHAPPPPPQTTANNQHNNSYNAKEAHARHDEHQSTCNCATPFNTSAVIPCLFPSPLSKDEVQKPGRTNHACNEMISTNQPRIRKTPICNKPPTKHSADDEAKKNKKNRCKSAGPRLVWYH